jgi:hypothetical protein
VTVEKLSQSPTQTNRKLFKLALLQFYLAKKTKGENMFKKYLPIMLIVLVVNLLCSLPVIATTKEEEAAKFVEKVKANIIKLGTGTDAKVEVKLKDGTKIKGYIRQIYEDSFVVIDEKTGASTEIPYPQTKQIKGHNLSKGVTIAIVVGVVAVVLAIAIIFGNDR